METTRRRNWASGQSLSVSFPLPHVILVVLSFLSHDGGRLCWSGVVIPPRGEEAELKRRPSEARGQLAYAGWI